MKPMFLSLVRPDRISSPITSTAAVTISGCAFMQVLFKQVLLKSGRTPSVAPRTTQVAEPMAQARLVPQAGPRSNFRHPLAFGLGSCQNKLTGFKPWLVADLLSLNEQMPRSLASCYVSLVEHLDGLKIGLISMDS